MIVLDWGTDLRVGTELMTFIEGPLDNLRESLDAALVHAVEEECRDGAVCGEDIQHLGCVDVWSIVEGEGHGAGDCAVSDDCSDWDAGGVFIVWF